MEEPKRRHPRYARQREFQYWGDGEEADADEDIALPEFLDAVERFDRNEYDVVEMMNEAMLDTTDISPGFLKVSFTFPLPFSRAYQTKIAAY